MAVITPTTDVYLLKVPLEINDLNQLTFSNATAQHNYFNSLPKLEVHDFTYQRKDGVIRYGANYDSLLSYNYVMYRNDEFSNKWFYAFITNLEWKSPNSTEITIKTDVWQTYQFDISFKPVLIDREHTNNDAVGANTLPEGLELGDMVTNGTIQNFGSLGDDFCTVVDVTMVENTGDSATLSNSWDSGSHAVNPIINGIDSGVIHLIINYQGTSYRSAQSLIDVYDFAGLGNAVTSVYFLPRSILGSYWTGFNITATRGGSSRTFTGIAILKDSFSPTWITTSSYARPTSLAGFTPVNKKLLTYPFCYCNVSNNAGTSVPYRYEDFTGGSPQFRVEGAFTPSGSVRMFPLNYKNIESGENSLDYGITGAKYPIGNWVNDTYTNWLTQNAVNMRTQWTSTMVSAGVDVIGGSITGGLGGGVFGTIAGAKEIITTAREQHLAKTRANITPDTAQGNLNAGDVVWSKIRSKFTYIPMCIKPEYAHCIDEFFSQYGYKCNRVKVPNITGRRNWNYVKTVGCYIEGNIPQEDMSELKNMFDRGITLWHNPSTFADYSQNNDII